ncbi:energy transducer TonB [Bacteroides sp. 519]|uniref:energy transducer TonB n=1 Tax=Bacteroides sp. 519 TaxID=2302937 RepID=UPI0013D3203B|nr:energy transducer TonB [Bacteroides sp. 519]
MKAQYLYLLAILFLFCACSTSKSVVQTKPAYPVFPGGEDSLQSFLKARIYFPDTLQENRIVHANCEVDSLGRVMYATAWGFDSECEQLIKSALQQMPEWILTEKNVPSTSAKCAFLFKFKIPGLEEQPFVNRRVPPLYEFIEPEHLTSPPGDETFLEKYMQKVVGYPLSVRLGRKGDVVVRFTINKDGSIIDPTLVKGLGKRCNHKIMHAVQTMPKWRPGLARGISRRSIWEMTLSFGKERYPAFTCKPIEIISYRFYISACDPVFKDLPQGPFQRYSITIEKR